MKLCIKCQIERPETEFYSCGSYKGIKYYRPDCKSCVKTYLSSEKGKEAQRKYRNSSYGKSVKQAYKKTDKYIQQQNEYGKARYKTDKLFACKKNLRDRLSKALKSKKWKKNTHFSEYIGCTREVLLAHLEAKFTNGMIWENYGKWEIDHIIPLSSAKTPEEMYKLCHYTNLQPLWAKDNQLKSNK